MRKIAFAAGAGMVVLVAGLRVALDWFVSELEDLADARLVHGGDNGERGTEP